MKRQEAAQAWIEWLVYGSFALVYLIPFLACAATPGLCDPFVQGNFLSVSKVIRSTYWNTSFAFVSALFIASATQTLLVNTKSRLGRFAAVGSALCAIVPAVVPLDDGGNQDDWHAVDIVHTVFAVATGLFNTIYFGWIVRCKAYAVWRLPLIISAVAFGAAVLLLVVATLVRYTTERNNYVLNVLYFVGEYVISAALFGLVRTVIQASHF
jgi:hypothetical protein